MTLEEFAGMQKQVAERGGMEMYLPVVWMETEDEVKVSALAEGYPEGADPEAFCLDFASTVAGDGEFFLAFPLDDTRLKTFHRAGEKTESLVVRITPR